MRGPWLCARLWLAALLLPAGAFAQSPGLPAPPPARSEGVTIDGPPPPVHPATVSRDKLGRTTIRAVRVHDEVRVDGRLDESIYQTVTPIGDFVQTDPSPGEPATERTDVWIFFDEDTLYVGARLWDSQPPERWIANEMRRDSMNVVRNENLAVFFDTFYDRRNAFLFEISPIGGIYDAHITNERAPGNTDYNPIWDRQAGRFEGGWTAEMAIPFRSLRYRPGASQVWGINIRRTVRWKNEESFVLRMPLTQGSSIFQISSGATLVGIDAPPGSRNVEIKPYAIAGTTTDRRSRPPVANDVSRDAGFDVKFGLTQNLTADFTYNTDFAQVEVDEQQVNLTRFNLFFPEKREFFLEGQGIFDFGGATGSGGGGGLTPLLFFSRRIGLNGSRIVPIETGGRLTGKIGKTSIGALDVRTGEDQAALDPPTNFAVVRVKRDILRRSSVGALVTSRSNSSLSPGSASETYGADTTLGFYDNLTINAYLARTETPGVSGDNLSYRTQLAYGGNRYGVGVEHLFVGDNFNPEIGFVRRDDVKASAVSLRFSPRPSRSRLVRRYSYVAGYEYLTDGDGRLETKDWNAQFATEFHSSDRLSFLFQDTYDILEVPFGIASGVTIPAGGYSFRDLRASLALGNQRRVAGSASVSRGSFYGGDRTSAGLAAGRIELSSQFSMEPAFSVNWIDLPYGRFHTTLASNRATYTMTPRMFVSGLLQYNSSNDSLSSNLRLRWEYRPGSELFVVYTDERETGLERRLTDLRNRAFVVKINRLFRF